MLHYSKTVIVNFIKISLSKINQYRYHLFLKKIPNESELVIFDLDNTLADTFPYIKGNDIKKIYSELPALDGMAKVFNEALMSNKPVVVLTARNFQHYTITKKWIRLKLSPNKNVPVFLVSDPVDKVYFLKKSLLYTNHIVYYDDLSYNHEHGTIKFYDYVIEQVKSLPIVYIGYDNINFINKKN